MKKRTIKNNKIFGKLKSFAAFTLAEVLITLGIIGVVAAITIPALLGNIQDAQLRSAWKKNYSVLAQAATKMLSENGGTFKGVNGTPGRRDVMAGVWASYLNVSKTCITAGLCNNGDDIKGTCWHNDGAWKDLNGINVPNDPWNYGCGLILNDGTMLSFWNQDGTGCSYGPNGNNCGHIFIDVNGFKGPNQAGKDIYGISVNENQIVPYGAPVGSTTCTTTDGGWGCAAKYLIQ